MTWRKTIPLIRRGSNGWSGGCRCWKTRRRSAISKPDTPPCATSNTTPLGRFEGREAIRNFFRGASKIFSFAIHYSLNGQIEVDGDTARAQWYLFMPCLVAAGNRAMWRASIDHETYARVDGTWMFSGKRSEPLMNVPFETGWAETRFA